VVEIAQDGRAARLRKKAGGEEKAGYARCSFSWLMHLGSANKNQCYSDTDVMVTDKSLRTFHTFPATWAPGKCFI
jgi:hypothetical protein